METYIDAGTRAMTARGANGVARESNRAGAPTLSERSTRETLCDWLQWLDPNGIHTDALAEQDHAEPYTLESAWEAVDAAVRGELGSAGK